MRTDLGMPVGKMIAQGAHASMKAIIENPESHSVKEWLSDDFTKIAVGVGSEEELHEIIKKAQNAGLITALITDNGRTVFNGVKTNTCAAIGPASREDLVGITGHLKLI